MPETTSGESGQSSKQQVQQKAQQVQEKAGQATQQVQEKAQEAAHKAESQVRQQVDQRSSQTGQQLETTADAIRRTGDQLRNEGQQQPARVLEFAAERAERLGRYLQSADGDQILSDVEGVVRKRPWLVAGVGGVLGFAAARFVKASSERRSQQPDGGRPHELPPVGEPQPRMYDVGAVEPVPVPPAYGTPVEPAGTGVGVTAAGGGYPEREYPDAEYLEREYPEGDLGGEPRP